MPLKKDCRSNILKRSLLVCSLILLVFGILHITYWELVEKEHGSKESGAASNVVTRIRGLVFLIYKYLNDVPNPGMAINLINELKPYAIAFAEQDILTRIEDGYYAFYVTSKDLWIGYALPELLWTTPGSNYRRNKLRENRGTFGLYGSDTLDAPPLSADESHLYRPEDNVIWMRWNRKKF